MNKNPKDVFIIYEMIKPLFYKKDRELKELINKEYKDIQYMKTTSINKNYLFADSISVNFYNLLNTTKVDFKNLISSHVKCTKNYDSLDGNNILLLCIIRYSLEIKNEVMYKATMRILTHKLYYPLFNNYFKYGVDENSFKYFTDTINRKYDIAKYDTIYDVVDSKSDDVASFYKKDLIGNIPEKFLLIPVHIKTRLNQFFKQIMGSYKIFLANNKAHLNASRDLEGEDGDSFSDQERNNSSINIEYKNKLFHNMVNMDLPDNIKYSILHKYNKCNKRDVDNLYSIIKNNNETERVASIFLEMKGYGISADDKGELLKFWLGEVGRYKDTDETTAINNIIFKYFPEYKSLEKRHLIEIRKLFITLIFIFYLKIKH